jgi:hypothetical protein
LSIAPAHFFDHRFEKSGKAVIDNPAGIKGYKEGSSDNPPPKENSLSVLIIYYLVASSLILDYLP